MNYEYKTIDEDNCCTCGYCGKDVCSFCENIRIEEERRAKSERAIAWIGAAMASRDGEIACLALSCVEIDCNQYNTSGMLAEYIADGSCVFDEDRWYLFGVELGDTLLDSQVVYDMFYGGK